MRGGTHHGRLDLCPVPWTLNIHEPWLAAQRACEALIKGVIAGGRVYHCPLITRQLLKCPPLAMLANMMITVIQVLDVNQLLDIVVCWWQPASWECLVDKTKHAINGAISAVGLKLVHLKQAVQKLTIAERAAVHDWKIKAGCILVECSFSFQGFCCCEYIPCPTIPACYCE
jgi:hypothetical protein